MKTKVIKLVTLVLTVSFSLCILVVGLYAYSYFQNDIKSKILDFPLSSTGTYDSIIINKYGEVVVLVKEKVDGKWLFAKENSEVFGNISLPLEPREICSRTVFEMYETMPSGFLQIEKTCLKLEGSINSLLSYDLETGELHELVTNIPSGGITASWRPDQKMAVGSFYDGFASSTLFWLWKGGYEPMDLIISEGDYSWNLKDDFPNFEGSNVATTGNAERATWSPDGNLIAFWGSPEAIGVTGFDRLEVNYHLYLMDSVALKPYSVQTGIHYPHIMKWSPDSHYIAFIGFLKQKGLWLYSLDTNSISLISKGDFRTLVWKGNGNIVALRCADVLICNQVEEFDIANHKY